MCERVAADKKFQRKSFRVEKKKSRKAQGNNFYLNFFLYRGFRELIVFCLFGYLCVVIITCFIFRQVLLSDLFSKGLRNGLHNYETKKTIKDSLKRVGGNYFVTK